MQTARRTTGGAGTLSHARVQGTGGTPGGASRRTLAERASREVAVAVTAAVGVPKDDESAAQRMYDLRSGRKYVWGPLLWWGEQMRRRGAPPSAVRMTGEMVHAYFADLADEMETEARTVRRATPRERERGVLAHIAPNDSPDPSPCAPARRAA